MRGLHPDTITALEQGHVRWLVLTKVEFDSETLAFNSSFAEFTWNGTTFIGLGNLGNVSNTAENTKLDPADYAITITGVDNTVLVAALDQDYLNRPATCWVAALDDNMQIIGEPILYFKGLVDSIDGTYGNEASVVISVTDRMAEWSRARISRYTNQEQQAKYPGDKGFEYVSEISTKKVTWPAKEWFEKNK